MKAVDFSPNTQFLGFPMEKAKRIEAEFELPESIIQHIQSFLTGKEAARTTILSKSWLAAWLTRPNLDFDEIHFGPSIHVPECENKFWELVNKTLQRYNKLNLKIESLRLWTFCTSFNLQRYNYSPSRSRELITKALKMGAVELYLEIHSSDFALPNEVLGSENLIKLYVGGCKIDVGEGGKLGCSRLKSLSLSDVHLERDIIPDIILSCPLIEKLTLCRYPFLPNFQGSNINSYGICKLKCLLLYKIRVGTLFFHDLSSKFPCLKDLGVHYCDGYKGLRISSPSLESISFTQHKMLRVKFDVPSIRKFTFSGSHSPSLSFTTARSNWESDITISCKRRSSATWFIELRKLLTKLGPSRVSLTIKFAFGMNFDRVGNVQGLSKPVVDNLKIHLPSSECHALFNILFRYCRPVYVTQYWLAELFTREKTSKDILEIVYKRLMQRVGQSKSGQCDLEEVIVEYFYEDVSVWRPLPWKSLVNDLTDPFDEPRIRFHLRWGKELATSE